MGLNHFEMEHLQIDNFFLFFLSLGGVGGGGGL